ncbi:bactofilin family protein [Leifsonia xyli]|uniref:bactofilin family protein n=1 Tax=Leifsonia xyli TaxID=1575 RepID=UPI003D672D95
MNTRSRATRVFAAVAAVALVVLCAGAAQRPATADGQVTNGQGPHFYSGTAIDVAGPVDGDVYAAGQSVTITGAVRGDVIAAAQSITISGTVDGNVRLAAQNVTLTGDVTRSGTIFAASLLVDRQARIGRDLVTAGSSIRLAGRIGRDVVASVADLTVDGTIGGDLTYSSSAAAHVRPDAVAGTVEHVQPQQAPRVEVSPWAIAGGWLLGVLYALVALSLIMLAAALLVPKWLNRVTDELFPSPWRALLVGLVAAIVVPIALLFLLVTIIGAPLALGLILIWIVLTLATFAFSAHYLGRLILRGHHHPVLTSFVGGVILIVGLQIPWLNILVWAAMVLFGLGAELLAFRRERPWETGVGPAGRTAVAAGPAAPVVEQQS